MTSVQRNENNNRALEKKGAGTTAQISGDRRLDLIFTGVGIGIQKRFYGNGGGDFEQEDLVLIIKNDFSRTTVGSGFDFVEAAGDGTLPH